MRGPNHSLTLMFGRLGWAMLEVKAQESSHTRCIMLFTVGHSTHTFVQFAQLLRMNGVTAIADVRSAPYSRYNPQFNRETLKASLESVGIAYSHLGPQLGAMREEPESYGPGGLVDFSRTALTPNFVEGIQRIKTGLNRYAIAMMCAEKDPITCHRNLLITRFIREELTDIQHIRGDGTIETQEELESRVLAECKLPQRDLFRSREDLVTLAYDRLAKKNAFGRGENEEPAVD